MTDRHNGYIVTLRSTMRSDDAEETITALKMVKGVIDVEPVVADPVSYIAATRERIRLREKILEFLRNG